MSQKYVAYNPYVQQQQQDQQQKYQEQQLQQQQVEVPPQYTITEPSGTSYGLQEVPTTRTSAFGLGKPVVVPQSTNIFMIKTFSPFARSYSPALAQLSQPLYQEEFLTFIDGLNDAFLSAPFFQAIHVAGGALLSTQILPVQGAGGVLQVVSLVGSAGVSFVRVRSYMKKANRTHFAPRGLTVKIMSTKKMMAAVGAQNPDGTMKLKLPPLDDTDDLGAAEMGGDAASVYSVSTGEVGIDPRVRRLRALQQYVSPLTFDTGPDTRKQSWFKRTSEAPLRFINKRQMEKMEKARLKSVKKRESLNPNAAAELQAQQSEINGLERKITHARANSRTSNISGGSGSGESVAGIDVSNNPAVPVSEQELKEMEQNVDVLLKRRESALKDVQMSGDKKLVKLYKKEEKIANRILWVVIENANGHVVNEEELFQVEGDGLTPVTSRQ